MKSSFALVLLLLSILGFVIRIGFCSRENRNSKYLKFDNYDRNVNTASDLQAHQNALSIYQPPGVVRNISSNLNTTDIREVLNVKRINTILSNATGLVRVDPLEDQKLLIGRKHHHHDDSHDDSHESHEIMEHDKDEHDDHEEESESHEGK